MEKDLLQKLIELTIDLEGDLRVARDRDDAEALALARKKSEEITALLAETPAAPAEPATPAEPQVVEVAEPAPEPVAEASVVLDTVAATKPRPDLRRSLTLNDLFRFRREIFAGSESDFNDTLDLLNSMSSADEATDYLIGDLALDAENPDVKDFIEIIQRHFK